MRAELIERTEQVQGKVSKTAREAGEQLTHFAKEAVRMKEAIATAIEDGFHTARRGVKHGYRATEDLIDDTKYRLKRDPLRAVGLCFVAGMAVGWLLPHRSRA